MRCEEGAIEKWKRVGLFIQKLKGCGCVVKKVGRVALTVNL